MVSAGTKTGLYQDQPALFQPEGRVADPERDVPRIGVGCNHVVIINLKSKNFVPLDSRCRVLPRCNGSRGRSDVWGAGTRAGS